MRFDVRLLLILTVATWGTGCADSRDPLLEDAFYRFQHENSCPANRLNVKQVKVPLADFVEPRQPPKEIAADAERLAVWNQTNKEELARYDRLTAVDISGCGHQADYFCWEKHVLHDNYGCIPMDPSRPLFDFTTLPLKPSADPWVRQQLGLPPAPPPPSPAAMAQPNPPPSSAAIRAEITAEIRTREKAMRKRMARESQR